MFSYISFLQQKMPPGSFGANNQPALLSDDEPPNDSAPRDDDGIDSK